MNLICNCCATGYLYKNILKEMFPNPFIWAAITPNDMIKLIKNWDNINFKNIKLEESFVHERKERNYQIVVDDLIHIHYTHYILSEKDNTPRIIGCNVYYKNVTEYTIEKYKTRSKRSSFLEEPIFLILDNKLDLTFNESEMNELLACTERKIVLISDKKLANIPTNILYFNESGYDHELCMKKHYKEIINFAKRKD